MRRLTFEPATEPAEDCDDILGILQIAAALARFGVLDVCSPFPWRWTDPLRGVRAQPNAECHSALSTP